MEGTLQLLKKDLKMMKGWFLGGAAVIAVVGVLGAWLAYQTRVGTVSFLISFLLFIHVFYIPAYVWRSLSKEWKGTYVYWLQFPQSGWTLLAMKLVSAAISLCASYFIAYAIFYGISQIEMNSKQQLLEVVVPDAFDVRSYIEYIRSSFLSMFSLILFLSVTLGVWVLLLNISIQAVRRWLHRFSGVVMLLLFIFLFWAELSFSNTQLYRSLTEWGAFTGTSAWAIIELHIGDVLFSLLEVTVFFFAAGWLVDRKVEV
ncbi:hypothetical protein [Aneurinibacillus aneurinilyticus]|uniref:hypothetical protein n=1 Tax=Aneurinibacillus aneurinilyticus TaxID=1391 RepID=UPI0023F22B26|nr:hypothetical protein [Aneurinibacillus aneurinilyticus]